MGSVWWKIRNITETRIHPTNASSSWPFIQVPDRYLSDMLLAMRVQYCRSEKRGFQAEGIDQQYEILHKKWEMSILFSGQESLVTFEK